MAFEDIANSAVYEARKLGRQAAENGSQAVKDGYADAQQYLQKKGRDFDLGAFVGSPLPVPSRSGTSSHKS
jgi:hypothetical protein